MFCSKCGKENADDAKFCSSCGANIGTVAEAKSIENVSNENSNKKVWLSIIAVAVGVLVIASPIIFFNNPPTEATPAATEEIAPATEEVDALYVEETAPVSISEDVFVDTYTNLMWQDNVEAKTVQKDWQGAIDYCENLTLAGFNDWRLPSRKKLDSIVDVTRSNPAIKPGFENVVSDLYWSSSSYVGDSNFMWNVNFYNGYGNPDAKVASHYVRCVRDSK